jgi:hypothetical protein
LRRLRAGNDREKKDIVCDVLCRLRGGGWCCRSEGCLLFPRGSFCPGGTKGSKVDGATALCSGQAIVERWLMRSKHSKIPGALFFFSFFFEALLMH